MTTTIKGWSQTIAQVTAGGAADGVLQASTDVNVVPNATTGTVASDRSNMVAFFQAGVPIRVRWGGKDGFAAAGSAWGAGLAANTAAWQCDVMLGSSQTSVATDSVTIVGAGGDSVDRTFSFTPNVSGTYRLKVLLTVTTTATGYLFADGTTDEGNFGSESPNYQTADSNKSFAIGYVTISDNALQTSLSSQVSNLTRNVAAIQAQLPKAASPNGPRRGPPFQS